MESGFIGRIPPQNIEAEQSVLGAMLLDVDIIPSVVEILKIEDFYREDHREVFKVILDLFESNEPIDLISVSENIRLKNLSDNAGSSGVSYKYGKPCTYNRPYQVLC